jgi:FkbM family methyltransferase
VSDLRERRARPRTWARLVTAHPRVLPLTALLLRARAVRGSGAFVVRELLRPPGAFAYRLRDGRLRVVVRHRGADPVTLGEVFHERDYEPPPELEWLRPRRIVDIGANVGYFGAFALQRWPDTTVIAYEPDPANAAVLAHTIALNGLERRWELRRAAASNRDGTLRFHASGDALSHAGADGELQVAARDVLPLLAGADLLKLDAEGGEWDILCDPRFVADPPAVVVMEYHPAGAPEPAPRAAALARLRAAGLTATATIFQRGDGYGMLWAWRP